MEPAEKSPALAGGPGLRNESRHDVSRPPRKWERVLRALLSGQTVNRFEAERGLHDHCLHTTVSNLQAKGLVINRKMEQVPGYQGVPTDCARYSLDVDSYERARHLLGIDNHRSSDRGAGSAACQPG
jgi:hypothetical protein